MVAPAGRSRDRLVDVPRTLRAIGRVVLPVKRSMTEVTSPCRAVEDPIELFLVVADRQTPSLLKIPKGAFTY